MIKRFAMPRATWRGLLRLSLVTCPVYLSPATTGTKPIRLYQVWQPAPVEVNEDALPDRSAGQQGSASSAPQLAADHTNPEAAQSRAATRIALRPHDPGTGEEIDKREIVKGYEYGRGQFVTLTPEELKALDVESSKVIDLEKFAPRGDLDPVYFQSSYYLYPDGPIAVEALRVIGAAMAEGELDAEMVAIAKTIIAQRTGSLDPTTYRDRYQEALRELLEAKMKGLTVKPREIAAPPPVIDLMAALKRSLAREASGAKHTTPKKANKMSRLSCCPSTGV